ncbi:DMT family transporter [Nocardioides sp. GY 10127]|uniref:EamA family transporter n=1 Tax=Nocardioides sp. GY 10127 TaxID=2569762 RepID=UPI0010A8F161|nr:DMT family transporter [Nocardioides sp. GY 10127]TIC84041.1 DMT family transporter [Nocardioides sp. GY 10127]
MTTMTHDSATVRRPASQVRSGLVLALVSSAAFGLSGALARGLLDAGWTPGAAVLARIAIAAVVVTPLGLRALAGRWHLLLRNSGVVVVYGLLAVAGAQFCYFSAVQHMQVGPALLIEYTAPAVVVLYLWLRQGQRPGRVTVLGAVLASAGLVLVLDLFSGASVSVVGVAWALCAMIGAATYFVLNADESNGLPPLTLAAGGLVVASLVLGVLGAAGVLPMAGSLAPVAYDTAVGSVAVPWWLPLLLLGVVTAGLAYTTGIAAGRRLGSRLASFVSLIEVLFAVAFAWLLLAELPGLVQILGGVLVLAGVVAVKLGEDASVTSATERPEPVPA